MVETGEIAAPVNEGSVPPTPGVETLDPVQKKLRNLNKKVRGVIRFASFGEGTNL